MLLVLFLHLLALEVVDLVELEANVADDLLLLLVGEVHFAAADRVHLLVDEPAHSPEADHGVGHVDLLALALVQGVWQGHCDVLVVDG